MTANTLLGSVGRSSGPIGTHLGPPNVDFSSSIFDPPDGFESASVAIAGTFDFPGPAAGFVRIYSNPIVLPETAAAPTGARADLLPANLRLWNTAGSANAQNFPLPPLGAGESVRFTNGAVNAVSVYAGYNDISAAGITLVRMQLSNVLAPLLPTPPAGFVNRWLVYGINVGSIGRTANARINACNADSVAQIYEVRQGAVWLGRASFGIGAQSFLIGMGDWIATPTLGAVEARTAAAPTTTPANFVGAYQTTYAVVA